MRRAAIALLAMSILLPVAAAQAGTEYTIQIHNNSSHTVDFVFQKDPNYFHRAGKIRHHLAPGDFFVSDGIKPDSCVVIRYLCKVHAGEVKDLVVTVTRPD